MEKRYSVVKSKVWVNSQTGQKVSPYGACPWPCESQRELWSLQPQGWSIYDSLTNTYGMGRPPFPEKESAKAQARIWNDQYEGRLKATRQMVGEQLKEQ